MNDLDCFSAGTRMEEARLPSGLTMRWYERGPARAPVVLCLHGWPELAVSWRGQLDGLGDRWRVVAPDMRGYGGTDAPARVADYRMPHLCGDVADRAARPSMSGAPVEVPTRLSWGLGDAALGPWFAKPERYRACALDFDLVVVEDAGHWVQQEAPERVNAALAEHIERR